MAKKEIVELLVDGGKASAGPGIGGSLGPLGINIGQVLTEINKQTAAFKGMKVPVKIIVDKDSKEFTIEIGTPPTSQLIMKELGIEKGSGVPNKDKVGNIALEQVVKVAQMKRGAMFVNDLKAGVKNVAGSAHAMGVMVEGRSSHEVTIDIDAGKYDDIILHEKTEASPEKLEKLKAQLDEVQAAFAKEMEKAKAEAEAAAAAAASATPAAGTPAAAPGKTPEVKKEEAPKKEEKAATPAKKK